MSWDRRRYRAIRLLIRYVPRWRWPRLSSWRLPTAVLTKPPTPEAATVAETWCANAQQVAPVHRGRHRVPNLSRRPADGSRRHGRNAHPELACDVRGECRQRVARANVDSWPTRSHRTLADAPSGFATRSVEWRDSARLSSMKVRLRNVRIDVRLKRAGKDPFPSPHGDQAELFALVAKVGPDFVPTRLHEVRQTRLARARRVPANGRSDQALRRRHAGASIDAVGGRTAGTGGGARAFQSDDSVGLGGLLDVAWL